MRAMGRGFVALAMAVAVSLPACAQTGGGALAPAAGSAAVPAASTAPAISEARAELCYAHAVRDIRRSASTGRVPGPAWQVRDFWEERLETDPQSASDGWVQALDARAATEAAAVDAEGVVCAHQALDALEAAET